MVNLGKPSRGCAVCRKRRIKCDEREGGCSYCLKTKQICPGYKDSFTLAWRDQTATARNKVQRRKASQEQTLTRHSSPSLSPPPPENPHDHAVAFFFGNHIFVKRDPQLDTGFMPLVPGLFSSVSVDSPLYLATSMMAMRMMEPWIDARREFARSRQLYGRALVSAREQVEAYKDCWSDEFLLTVLLLDMYEGLNAQHGGGKVETHVSGAAALIRRRPLDTYQTLKSKDLLLAAYKQVIQRSLRNKTHVPSDILDIISSIPNLPPNHSNKLDPIQVELASLQADAAKVLSNLSTLHSYEITLQIDRALTIDAQLSRWAALCPDKLLPIRLVGDSIPPSVRAAGIYQEHADMYYTLVAGHVWLSYHVLRMRVHNVILSLTKLLSPSPFDLQEISPQYVPLDPYAPTMELSELEIRSRSAIQSCSDDICAALPYYMGDRIAHSATPEDHSITFPIIPGTSGVDSTHYRATAVMSKWFMLAPFMFILGNYSKGENKTILRDGQIEWIQVQIKRMSDVHGGPRAIEMRERL